ncbi:MAG: LytTR family DNA-binding domain-containing protein [Bacteroidales bacterium]|nr:LytTR family DNA-binding domain-containing protein [Bacteroidales bacterium]MDD4575007.1 LytTR family DNA-binding domain-containing protein [Bacteroidales bacterium]
MKVAIVEDEKKMALRIEKIVKTNFPEAEITGIATHVEDAVSLLVSTKPQIVLMDIHLVNGTGFDVIERVFPFDFKLVFITAYEQFAIKAFKFSALDYVLKPFDDVDIIQAISRAKEQILKETLDIKMETLLSNLHSDHKESKKIVLKTNDSIYVAKTSDIIRLESDGAYTRFFFADGKNVFVSKNLKEFDDLLAEFGFIRIHQSHLINMEFFARYQKGDGGFVVMKDGSKSPVSTRKKDALMEYLNCL